MNLCGDYGYSYQSIAMEVTTSIKYPSCYKTIIQSLTDWSQWTKIITKFPNNPYLFGLLDTCTMSSDNANILLWEYSPVAQDSGDVVLSSNDIFAAPLTVPATGSLSQMYYNTPKANILSSLGSTTPTWI